MVVALVLGAGIGLERERKRHPAGFRTMAMVSVGSCLFTLAELAVFGEGRDSGRIAAQVVTGVGFLGAGAIIRQGSGIHGLTTAAAIWVVAAVGMASAFGAYVLAAGSTAITLLALALLRPLERRLFERRPASQEDDEN